MALLWLAIALLLLLTPEKRLRTMLLSAWVLMLLGLLLAGVMASGLGT